MPRLRRGGSWGWNSRPSLVAPVASLPPLLSPGREAPRPGFTGWPDGVMQLDLGGRLYVGDWPAFRASVARLGEFVAAGNPVDWVLGAHIELTSEPGQDYEMGADKHPDEHVLQLRPAVLTELVDVVAAAGDDPVRIERDHFIVFPV